MKQVVRTFLKNAEGKILLVKHKNTSFWALPGGHLEEGENIYKCLKREIREEFGIEIRIL